MKSIIAAKLIWDWRGKERRTVKSSFPRPTAIENLYGDHAIPLFLGVEENNCLDSFEYLLPYHCRKGHAGMEKQ
jgi:hypothetical protein